MTMATKSRKIAAGEFKAKCLALLDEVDRTKQPLVITKRGVPVAKLVPIGERDEFPLLGSVTYEQDLVAPTGERWAADP
ncbi:MAG TPA: type II toxin-antitoxin system prevent-host-death family antitoxin [Myxococcaceae bacterium]|jgi:prevent-host-death family protein|nr:type II toxin-antitoxin system prevent-host-death family antitoxin [Myxococcaceae bacterium]